MEPAALLPSAADDARFLLASAQIGWDRPVPHCPDWDAAGLVRHTGGVLGWMAAIVTAKQRVARRELPPPPQVNSDLPAWYLANVDQALDVLGSADPGSETWTFSSRGDRRVAWWQRRLAVEVAIHRWDAEYTAASQEGAPPAPLDGEVAAAGVEEFVLEFLPGLLSGEGVEGLGGTLHLHATDGATEWWIDLSGGGAARPEHAKADTAIRGTRSDLLLWLNNREPADPLDVFGPRDILERWGQLRF